MAPQNIDKLVISIIATIITVTAWSLVIAGSFVPRWARPLNTTQSNSSYSLWGREDCYDVICTSNVRKVKRVIYTYWNDENGEEREERETEVTYDTITKCVPANFCNTTWFEDEEFEKIPSLLFVSRAFVIPSIITGLITIILYVIKIVMLVLRPAWRRIHVKAAYLTFAAVAGCTAGISVIIFVTMIEKDILELLWAPTLPGIGAFLFLAIAVGGYLSWRNHSTDDEFDDQSEISDRASNIYEFSSTGHGKPAKTGHGQGQGHGHGHGHGHLPGAMPVAKGYHRTMSNQSAKSELV